MSKWKKYQLLSEKEVSFLFSIKKMRKFEFLNIFKFKQEQESFIYLFLIVLHYDYF